MLNKIEQHILAIWGPSLGGKTTLAANMATVLADSGYMTCLVSANDHGELQSFFGASIGEDKGLYAAMSNGKNVREALIEVRPNLCLLEPNTEGDSIDISSITQVQTEKIIDDLSDQFNYVIIDCTSHKESAFTAFGLAKADSVLICIPHRASAAMWHISNRQIFDAIAPKVIYIDCNTHLGGCDVGQLHSSIGLSGCGACISYVESAFSQENTGDPVVLRGGREEKRYKQEITEIIQLWLGQEKKSEEPPTQKQIKPNNIFHKRNSCAQETANEAAKVDGNTDASNKHADPKRKPSPLKKKFFSRDKGNPHR